ncbi:hypothetical protein DWUX_2393 [Desulfovibrio diazotrophicus]|nr:hypothetical protein DWUX_2393 [Desulfovibrio diazotrophicus]
MRGGNIPSQPVRGKIFHTPNPRKGEWPAPRAAKRAREHGGLFARFAAATRVCGRGQVG